MTNDPNTPNGAADVLAVIEELIDSYSDHCANDGAEGAAYPSVAATEARQRLDAVVAALLSRNAELEAERGQSDKYAWTDGFPPYPHAEEWFLADTEFGPAVLRSLPKEYAYDYKTADETYIKKNKVKRWMQLPGSEFVAYESRGQIFELRAERDALIAERDALDHKHRQAQNACDHMLANYQEEAARIDYIEEVAKSSRTGVSFDWCRHAEECLVTETGYRMMRHRSLGPRANTLRAAIDAARTAAGEVGNG